MEIDRRESLFILGGDESIRGSMPFYGNRKVSILLSPPMLLERIARRDLQALMMTDGDFNRMLSTPEFARHMDSYHVERLDFPGKADSFVLLLSENGK